ncbi:hypothetical protein M413DRAFT_134409 [Hebeloma cylindrosporum]|uniref:HNH nuclease domain-containing protein n=1 Tax=Hebeloma cylindrosporum TaxID=76867 RepID=A0A0C2XXQ3_HEBCY|nr:hypothetical protein M413DRAFT_134409 [Hebeloma cylindrosporum h7]
MEIARSGDRVALSILLHRRECDLCAVSKSPSILNSTYHSSPKIPAILEVVHILPWHFLEQKNKPETVQTWGLLNTWTSIDIQEWVRQNANSPGNAILLAPDVRALLENFYLWLDKVEDVADSENSYRLQVDPRWVALVHLYHGRIVTFQDHSSTGVQLPLSEALAIHASIAKALHASGAADFFRGVLKDKEDAADDFIND